MSLLRAGAYLSLIFASVGSIRVPDTATLKMEGMEGEQILKHSLYLSLLPTHPPAFQPESFALRPRPWLTYHGYPSSIGRGNLKRKGGTWDEHTVRKDNVKAWQEDSQLQARREASEETNPADTLTLDF
ncbi:uncharacterized protein LOC116525362 [Sapajus apella]|uniref:Uncharacterized protein LOC116525362 n=1 Tax=Sapajus apella TaxID=9515 RepID=A0A6J3ES87_SAPAP|nr:uncharacterized protein LOC116525362 [Sapajus apella]